MLKRIISSAAAVLMLIGCTGCGLTKQDTVDVTYETEIPPRMMFLGDSIAAGFGLDGYSPDDLYSCRSYANILHDRYTVEFSELGEHEMQNFAVSGSTSADLLQLINSGKLDAALADTDAVVVSIGGNDMLGYLFDVLEGLGISPEERSFDPSNIDLLGAAAALIAMDSKIDDALDGFEDNLKLISDGLSAKTKGTVYIQTLYDPFESIEKIPKIADFSKEKIMRLNEIIRVYAEDRYTVIDVSTAFRGKANELTRIGEFDIHPNEAGHEVIAELVDKKFRSTGFTYTRQELGEPHLSALGIAAVIVGIVMAVAVVLFVPKMFKKF